MPKRPIGWSRYPRAPLASLCTKPETCASINLHGSLNESSADARAKGIIVIATMIALGRWEEFRLHTRAALVEGKFSQDDIKEIILQQAIYCGVPAANSAMKEAGEVLEEISKSKT